MGYDGRSIVMIGNPLIPQVGKTLAFRIYPCNTIRKVILTLNTYSVNMVKLVMVTDI